MSNQNTNIIFFCFFICVALTIFYNDALKALFFGIICAMGQLIKRENLGEFVSKLRRNGKSIVVTNGCFDILHVGHVRYLQKTKSYGDYLIVMLNSDKSVRSIKGEGRPINNENNRAEVLCALACVDFVVLFDENSPRNLIDEIKPDVYTKGADYTLETLPERDIIEKNGIKVEFIEFVDGQSTTNIINKISNKE